MSLWPQRCKICGKRDHFDFTVPDDLWKRVVPEPYQQRVVCLGCFDTLASQRGIDYARDLYPEVYFAGDKASFTLRIVNREEAPKC